MTARVKGPTDNVVVVGAGLAGLSAALRLAGAGRKVTVIERESVPGGRNGLLNKSGFSFDTGPSVLTMPDLISDALACVGEDIKDWLDLVPLKPLYRAFYDDGTQKVNQFLKDPRTQKVYSFQAMYAGVSPQQALAIYAVIAYMDSVNGVFFPKGGMHAVPRALAGAAEKHGVTFKYNTTVTSIERENGRAKAVITDTGERFACDVVVLNPDLPIAWRDLLGKEPLSVKRLKYSPSCVTLLVGSNKSYDHLAHHNIHFGKSWDGVFDELIKKKTLMSDPSILVTVPSMDDPSLAPAGKTSYYVLFPTPNLTADIDWQKIGPKYRDEMVKALEDRGYKDFGKGIEVEQLTTPLDWEMQGMAQGAPFASAHTFLQTGPFRPRNLAKGYENIVFAGSGTQPGVGVPMVLISGRLAAERIVGPVK